MTAPPIRCRNLSRFYGEVQGLSGLNLEAGPGVIGLLGPNGSGKTTLMRLLCGLIQPSEGVAEVFGSPIGPGRRKVLGRIGHCPSEDIHFESERALDFLSLLASLGGESPASACKRGEEALAKVGLSDKAMHRMDTLSKGMRQRIKVAQALLFSPELLLLDEPLNGMDPVSRKALLDLIKEHSQAGGTVLLASHVLHEVEAVTDQVVLLHHGRLLAEGKLPEIRSLIDQEPRRIVLQCSDGKGLVADLLKEDLVTGVGFTPDGRLALETSELRPLLTHLQAIGEDGGIDQLEISDQNLESIFGLLVGGET